MGGPGEQVLHTENEDILLLSDGRASLLERGKAKREKMDHWEFADESM
jgi:hypothetical protein